MVKKSDKELLARKSSIISTLSRTEKYVNESNVDNHATQLQCRLEAIKPLHSEYISIITDIQLLNSSQNLDIDDPELNAELEDFESRYFSLISKMSQMIKLSSRPSSPISDNTSNIVFNNNVQVRLPQIQLPKFKGDFRHWINFKDKFNSLIHTNPSLHDVQRLHYLKSCLESPASDLITSLETTDSNYTVAWNLIKSRYDNERLISNSHVISILNIPHQKCDSLQSLKDLTYDFFKHVNALKALGEKVDTSAFLLLPILTSKMNVDVLKRWEGTLSRDSKPTLTDIESFLLKQIDILELSDKSKYNEFSSNSKINDNSKYKKPYTNNSLDYKNNDKSRYSYHGTISSPNCSSFTQSSGGGSSTNIVPNGNRNYNTRQLLNSSNKKGNNPPKEINYPCYICKQLHRLYMCPTFNNMTAHKRLDVVSDLKLCQNCFNTSHDANNCFSKFKCKVCGLKHNTLVHQDSTSVVASSIITRTPSVPKTHKILLATALVDIVTPKGQIFTVRALLDGGSQSNFICRSLVQQLNLPTIKCNIPIKGISQTRSVVNQKISSVVKSRINTSQFPMQFLVLEKITEHLPQDNIDISQWNIPSHIQLADPEFHRSNKIDILIGAESFLDILSDGQFKLGDSLPTLQFTKFGWIISGKHFTQPSSEPAAPETFLAVATSVADSKLDTLLPKFWELENSVSTKPMSKIDQDVERYYSETVKKEPSGRYSVRLPFSKDSSLLGSSSDAAMRCLYSMERRFVKQPLLKKQYQEFMSEYQRLGHMRELTKEEYESIYNFPHYFLPHHAVIREDSKTTKLRVVFNASMPTSTGVSLNDILSTGPSLQNELFSILLKFRSHKYALISDIEKMFRQFLVQHPDQYFQLVFWRDDPNQPVKIYSLLTVTYGTAPAPYLAIKTLHQLASDESANFPLASKVLLEDFYVDDLLSGTNSLIELRNLKSQLSALLKKGGMSLRKWCSNCTELFDDSLPSNDSNYILDLTNDDIVKTLGVFWQPSQDNFVYHVNFPPRDSHTKRTIISDVCRIYDPIGLLGPAIMLAKLFIKELWLRKFDWDDELSPPFLEQWISFVTQFTNLNQTSIPRHFSIDNPDRVELHGFCDASEKGYGACFYLKCVSKTGDVRVSLLCSKSRVSPTRNQSIPRLELCGALLLSELFLKVNSSLSATINIDDVFLWTDSTIVLHWIFSESCRWKTFVANRISQIQDNTTSCKWMHISSDDNPADILSRGSTVLSDQWWHGPSWLASINKYSPPKISTNIELPDNKQETMVLLATTEPHPLEALKLDKLSSWTKIYRVLSYILRFYYNCKSSKDSRLSGALTVPEIEKSQLFLIKSVQLQMFPNEIDALQRNKLLSPSSKILPLSPFLDSDKILRVGGRLKNAEIPFDQKHPILLPAKHHLTTLIVNYYHLLTLHAGPQHMLYSIRHRFWPINGKNNCKKVVRECTTCFRANPKSLTYMMGDLPAERLKIVRPFTYSGVDFAGPFMCKQSTNRKAAVVKVYACLFICMSTKAVHLEAVSDLSSNAFIACLRRFMARRGICKSFFCDNGRNFVGADNQLKELYKNFKSKENLDFITSKFNHLQITFNWVPARSPTFSGLWERAVKSCKHHLRRIMGTQNLTFEELSTFLAQIEAQLNSRPITPLSDNPNDLNALCPSHFLVGEPLTTIPDSSHDEKPMNILTRWQRVQQAQQVFWRRWSAEYFNQLQSRSKWRTPSNPPEVGQLVLVKDDNMSPLHWVLARITALHPGRDGISRVASIRTSTGETRRALTKLCPLPIYNDLTSAPSLPGDSSHKTTSLPPCETLANSSKLQH